MNLYLLKNTSFLDCTNFFLFLRIEKSISTAQLKEDKGNLSQFINYVCKTFQQNWNTPTGASTTPNNFDLNKNLNIHLI